MQSIARTVLALILIGWVACPAFVEARDWFVRAGALGGDGSFEKPFADPWMALERVEAHDKVHVSVGTYLGKLERGNWVIEFPGVELLGGYDLAFKERNPWKHVSELAWKRSAPNRPDVSLARISTGTQRDTAGATIDGFLIDMQEYYDYAPAPDLSMQPQSLVRNGAVSLAPHGVLRNCQILNAVEAVRASSGAVVENTVIMNSVRAAVIARGGGDQDPPVIIRNNTIAVVWDPRVPGQGGAAGLGIDATTNVTIEDNLLVHADNTGVSVASPGKATVSNNVFYRNLFSNVAFMVEGKASSLDDSDITSDAEVGFKKAGGNIATDPQLAFERAWYERFLQRTSGLGKRFMETHWAETRKAAGLPASTGTIKVFAPPYPSQSFLPLLTPHHTELKQGARMKTLPVVVASAESIVPVKDYTHITLDVWAGNPTKYDGVPIEIVGGIAGVAGVTGVEQVSAETHKGAWLVDTQGENRTLAVFQKGTTVERRIDSTSTYGAGPPRELFVIRGTARVQNGFPKQVVIVESIAGFEPAVVATPRPPGRTWYVRTGESGGDGSQANPFKDPYQALEVAQSGDSIHVAEGEYGGKLKMGRWIVDKPFLALYGGWDRAFRTRDPWKTPTLLAWPSDSKTQGQGYLLEGGKDHTGLLLDGFVFDRRTLNHYDKDGFVVPYINDAEHLWVYSPETVVRNCTFVNGSGGAVRISNAVTFENNIVANVWSHGVKVNGGVGNRSALIRNNTILFVFDRNVHDDSRTTGTGIQIDAGAAAAIEGNVIQYADNFAVRVGAPMSDVTLINNSFFRNGTVFRSMQGMSPPTVDEKSMRLLQDLSLKRMERNSVTDGRFQIDAHYYASWFARTSAITARFTAEEWKAIAPPVPEGQPVKPGAGRVLDWRQAARLVPLSADVKGARPQLSEAHTR